MTETDLRAFRDQVSSGTLTRREATRRLLGLGLSLPMAWALLAGAGVTSAQAQGAAPYLYAPTRRGGGGALRMLFWQAPTTLNPHFATGTKDGEASRIFYEGLATWDNGGGSWCPCSRPRSPAAPTAAWPPMAAASRGS